jgi:hypothetical protein
MSVFNGDNLIEVSLLSVKFAVKYRNYGSFCSSFKKLLVVADKIVGKLKLDMRVRLEWRNGVFCALHFLIIASIGLIKDCEKTTKKILNL